MSLHLRSSTSTLSSNSYQSHDSTDNYSGKQKQKMLEDKRHQSDKKKLRQKPDPSD